MINIIARILLIAACFGHCLAVGFYSNSPHIQELKASDFNEYVYKTNYTTVVEFYAPWCGYCQKLKPIYQKVGKASDGLFQVAAVNCDETENKALCSKMQVKGYPTLMVFRPPKYDPNDVELNLKAKKAKHAGEVYNGERTFPEIFKFTTSRIKNYVKRIRDETLLQKFVSGRTKANKNKVILLTDKGKPTPMIKTIAIDYMSDLEVAYATIKDLNKGKFFETLNIDGSASLPQLVVIDKKGETDVFETYEGAFDKPSISFFLTKYGTPLEGPASEKAKQSKVKTKKSSKKSSKKKAQKAPKSHERERDEL